MILITGAARSGTSLVTKILAGHGARLGDPADINPLYENVRIRQTILKRYLKSVGADPLGQRTLPDTDNLPPMPTLASEIGAVLGNHPGPHAYKDAKITLVWPVFAAAFPAAKWVIVRRRRAAIVDSCIRTHFMKAHGSDRRAWGRWVQEHEKRFTRMKKAGLDLVEVWTDEVIEDPEAFRPVADHVGLDFNPEAVTGAIDLDLWHPDTATEA